MVHAADGCRFLSNRAFAGAGSVLPELAEFGADASVKLSQNTSRARLCARITMMEA